MTENKSIPPSRRRDPDKKRHLFSKAAAEPANILALRRLYPDYSGPLVQLRRASDGASAKFGFDAKGDLDARRIAAWAAGARLQVLTWYDQSPHGHGAGEVLSDNKWGDSGSNLPAQASDLPELVLNAQNGRAVIRFNGSNRMDVASPLNGLMAQTVLLTFKPDSVKSAAFLVSWCFTDSDIIPDGAGSWKLSGETPPTLNMGVDSTQWRNYAVRWRGNTNNGRQTFRDGKLISQRDTLSAAMSFAYRSDFNLGWFRWARVGYTGDVAEIVVFAGALADDDIAAWQADLQAYWNTYVPPLPVAPGPGPKLEWLGVNLSGPEFVGTSLMPGKASVDYWRAKGANIVRLPFRWERVQPVSRAELDPSEIGKIDQVVEYATGQGLRVILDVHNYGAYNKAQLGADQDSLDTFADLWSRLATHYRENRDVVFGLMNEPGQRASVWLPLVNAAIASIRATGANQTILVPGCGGSGVGGLPRSSGVEFLNGIVDPAHNWVLEGHQYFDAHSSGGSGAVASASRGVEVLMTTTNWARAHKIRVFLGEFGAGPDSMAVACLSNLMTHLQNNTDVWWGATLWGGGPYWNPAYALLAEGKDGLDQPQALAVMAFAPGGDKCGRAQPPIVAWPLILADATFTRDANPAFDQALSGGTARTNSGVYSEFTDITMECRVTLSGDPGERKVACGAKNAILLGVNGDGKAMVVYGGYGGPGASIDTAIYIADGTPHHLEICLGLSGAKLFVDGVLAGANATTYQAAHGHRAVVSIGNYQGGLPKSAWPGSVSEVAVWHIARHDANFTPPVAPLTGLEQGLACVWHLDGDGLGFTH